MPAICMIRLKITQPIKICAEYGDQMLNDPYRIRLLTIPVPATTKMSAKCKYAIKAARASLAKPHSRNRLMLLLHRARRPCGLRFPGRQRTLETSPSSSFGKKPANQYEISSCPGNQGGLCLKRAAGGL